MGEILKALSVLRVGKIIDEYSLQNDIASALDGAGVIYEKEYRLGTSSRVDFITSSGVVIEVKKGKPNRTKLVDQINKYSSYRVVTAVVIVVETSLRIPITDTYNDKPCAVVGLQKAWGIAL